MNNINLKENIYWIGVKDPDLKVFDIIMKTDYGTTYNAYLINDEKVAIIDAVKEGFFEEFMVNVKEIIGDKKVDYIISQHTELDHSGTIARLHEVYPDAKIIASRAGSVYLKDIINKDLDIMVIPEELSLGKTTLKFISAPNLHWPDTFFTYAKEQKVLFSCDFLGCHYCPKHNVVEGYEEDYEGEVEHYFKVIMAPFKKFVLSGLDKIKDLDLDMVCTSHGPIHTGENISKSIETYRTLASTDAPKDKTAVVLYISAYGNTEIMAKYINDKLNEKGIKSELHEITTFGVNESIEAIESVKGVVFGSPTINQDAVKPVWDVLSEVSAITNRGKAASAFGSYGWSGEGVQLMMDRMKGLKLNVVEGFKFKFVPNEDEYKMADEFVDRFIDKL